MVEKEDNPYEAPKTSDLGLYKKNKLQGVDIIFLILVVLVACIVATIILITLLTEYKQISSLCSLMNIKNEFGILLALVISIIIGLFVFSIIFFGVPKLHKKIINNK